MLGERDRRTQTSEWPGRQLTRVDFNRRLARVIFVRGGRLRQLETLADAARLLVDLENCRPLRPIWDQVATGILRGAATGEKADVEIATELLEQALRGERSLR